MNGDDLAELLRALLEEQQAGDASARAAWELAEAEEADPPAEGGSRGRATATRRPPRGRGRRGHRQLGGAGRGELT